MNKKKLTVIVSFRPIHIDLSTVKRECRVGPYGVAERERPPIGISVQI